MPMAACGAKGKAPDCSEALARRGTSARRRFHGKLPSIQLRAGYVVMQGRCCGTIMEIPGEKAGMFRFRLDKD
jgi:hypothetical protein